MKETKIQKSFHTSINWRPKKNMLNGLFVNGAWVDEPCKVKEWVKSFFGERYMEMENVRPQLDGVKFKESS